MISILSVIYFEYFSQSKYYEQPMNRAIFTLKWNMVHFFRENKAPKRKRKKNKQMNAR